MVSQSASDTAPSNIDWVYDDHELRVIGATELYTQAIILITDSLSQSGITKLRCKVEASGDHDEFHNIIIGGGDSSINQSVEREVGELVEQLLRPYRCRLLCEHDYLRLTLRATARLSATESATQVV